MQDTDLDVAGVKRLARAVIVQAIRDLGGVDISGLPQGPQRDDVLTFIFSPNFDVISELAGWEGEWLLDVFKSVDNLADSVKRGITRQTVTIMRDLP